MLAISFGWLISSLVVVENVFYYPGMGCLLDFAFNPSGLPLFRAFNMVTVLDFVSANLAADLLQARTKPRIRLDE
jgi:peptide/nickel transport system permease protein